MEVMKLLFWPHMLEYFGYENTSVIHALSALFHSGPDVYGILWKVIIVVAAFWGVFDFLVFIWRTILAVKPPVYQVTLKQITEKIKTVEKENRKLEENLSAWEPKPGILKTRSEGSMQRAMTTEECNLEEGKKKMQDHHAASGSLKEGEEDNFLKYVKKVRVLDEIGGQRNMDTGGKVDMNGCELVGKQQLLAADERAKLAEEKTQLYKIRLEECHGQMREAEITWRHQVALAEKKAQDSLLRAQELERENSELRRENSQLRRENSQLRRENSELRREDDELQREVAHLKQRLDATCRRRQVEEYMRQEPTPGGPHRLHPPLRASGPGGAPVRNGPAFPAQEAEETQVTVEAREPPPFAGPARVASPISCPVPPFWGYWPPPPGPVPWPLGPQPQPPMSPLGSGPGAAPVRNDSTCPPAATVEAQVTLCGGGPEPFQGPCHVGFPVCGLTSPSGAPAPGPPGCPAQPHPPPAAAPLDGVSVRHSGEERGEGSSSAKEERASEPEATKAESKKTPRKKKRNKKRQRVSGTVDAAPQELTDHNTLTSVGGAHAADTLDGVSVRHFGEERGEGSSSAKEERASEPKATKAESKKTPRKKKRNKKRQRVSGTVDAAPQELTDHNTLTSVGGAHAADTLADMGPGAAPVWPGNASPPAAAPEAQVTLCGGGPEPFQGPCHVGFPVCGPVCGLTSPSGAPAPGPPGCPAQPHPPPAAAPLDGVSVRHFGEERGEGSSSPKEERASEPEATKAESKKSPRKKKRNKKRQRVSGTVDAAPQELTDHNTLTSVGGAHAADTLADMGPGAAPVWPGNASPPAAAPEAQVTLCGGGPEPFQGPCHVGFPVCGPVCGLTSPSGAPAPGPPGCPAQPHPPPAAAPLDGVSVRHFGEERGEGSSSAKEERASEPEATKAESKKTPRKKKRNKKRQRVSGTVDAAPQELTDHNTLTSVGGAHAADTLDGVSVRHFGEERGEGSSSAKEERASEPEATKAESKKTPRKKKRNKKRQRVSGTVDAAPQELTDHNTLTSVGGAHAADTLDGVSVRHFGEEREGSSSAKEERASEPEATKAESKKTPRKKKRNKKRQRVSGTVDAAPQELTDHNTLTSVGGAHAADTLAHMGPGAAPVWPGNASPPAAAPEAQVPVNSRRPGTCPGPPGVSCPPGTPSTNSQMVFITATPTPLVASEVSVTGTSYRAQSHLTPEEASQLWQ
ncbi:uncharacterized protein [Vicugna pacos]|uniref:Uncharacterized protein isoform X2 n=1 Tax=Vicugna pacos TaxID=30538 RepID=A0ABM5CYW3_VICPA